MLPRLGHRAGHRFCYSQRKRQEVAKVAFDNSPTGMFVKSSRYRHE
jgi:hypothetical protein